MWSSTRRVEFVAELEEHESETLTCVPVAGKRFNEVMRVKKSAWGEKEKKSASSSSRLISSKCPT